MGKKRKSVSREPDEVYSRGPLTSARYGKSVLTRSHWPEGTHETWKKSLVDSFPKIVNDINSLVEKIAQLISSLPPDRLLHRAWWEMVEARLLKTAHNDRDNLSYLRMIDYVQSVIASIPPAPNQRKEVSDGDWTELRTDVGELFDTLNMKYQISRSAKAYADDPKLDAAFEQLQRNAQMYWCNVRGSRYQVHDPVYLEEVFLPHSAIFYELFNISAEDFVRETDKIWLALTFVFEKPERYGDELDRFDVQKNSTLPQKLLDELTWSPGEEKTFRRR